MRFTAAVLCLVAAACAPAGTGGSGGGGSSDTGGGAASGGGSGGGTGGSGDAPTWYRDVLPIAQARCMGCHRQGGIAPFSMSSYDTVRPQAAAMAADVSSRKMPPWPIDESCGGPYAGSLRLSDDEIAVINRWAEAGAPEGNAGDAPAAPDAGTALAADFSAAPSHPYTPVSSVTDDYHCFVIDPQLATDRDVVGYEIVPGVAAEVHHVALYTVDRAEASAKNAGGAGWTCFGGTDTQDQNLLGAWAPGTTTVYFPEGTGISLPSSKVVVMQVHYNTQNGVRTPDATTMKLKFASAPVTHAEFRLLVDVGFSVPPMAMGYTHSATFTMGGPVKVWGVFGHMHLQGHVVGVTTADSCLLNIPNWDFHWQEQYFYATPKNLTAQDRVKLSCTWNNTTTGTLRFGENTDQEMCVAALYVTQ